MLDILLWLLALELLGVIALPFAFALFPGLSDRGAAFAKPLGLLLLAYPLWLVGSFGVLPITRWTIVAAVLVLGASAALMARRRLPELIEFARRERIVLLAVEGAFLLAFVGWVLFKATHPAIGHTEQPMDFAFLNASLRAEAFPPEDPWLRGHGISYYYFGYLIMALPGKLTGIASPVLYNLALATIAALASAGVMGLVITLARRLGAGLAASIGLGAIGIVLLSLVGNLEGALEGARAWGLGTPGFWGSIGVKGLEAPAQAATLFPQEHWWWWHATRVIDTVVDGTSRDYTIQEFPFFSFLLGDLHPHVMGVPFVLLTLALALNLLFDDEPITTRWLRRRWASIGAIGLTLGALEFINAWDMPTLALIVLGVLALRGYRDLRRRPPEAVAKTVEAEGYAVVRAAYASLNRWPWRAILVHGGVGAALLGLAAVGYLPYYASLDTQVSGVLPVERHGTQPVHFALVWGLFVAALAPFVAVQAARPWRGVTPWAALLLFELSAAPLLVWLAAAPIFGLWDAAAGRVAFTLPLVLLIALALVRALQATRDQDPALAFVLGMVAAACFLLLMPELFYVVDLFNTRMNTVFKLYYQAWALLAVATPLTLFCSYRAIAARGLWTRRAGALGAAALAGLFLASLYYPIGAATAVSNGFRDPLRLDGIAHLATYEPGEHAAILWVRDNAQPGDAILEAVGDDYGPHGRVAAFTGVPTVLGWPGHELQWRGSSGAQGRRAEEVAAFYREGDVVRARETLERYDIRYVILGPRERATYGIEGLETLSALLDPVFSAHGVTIYEVTATDA